MVEPPVSMLLHLGVTGKALSASVQGDHQIELHPDVDDPIHLGEIGKPLGVDRPGEQHQILELHALLRGQVGHRAPVAVGEEVGGVEALVTDPLLQGEGRRPASRIRVGPCPFEALVVDVEGGLLPLQRFVEITPRLVPELLAGPGAVGESCGLRLAAPLP